MIFNMILVTCILILSLVMRSSKLSKEKADDIFLKIVFIVLFVLVAFRREDMGNDTISYLNLFSKCALFKWQYITTNSYFEIGYLIFNVLISYISNNPRVFMIIMSFVFNFVIYYFIKNNSKNYLLSVLIYICLLYFYSSMTMMRQFFAMLILLSSFKFIKDKKIVLFILSVVLASLFHSTAWVGMLIYPIYHYKYTKKRTVFILIGAIIGCMFVGPMIEIITSIIGRQNYYSDRVGSHSISNLLYTIIYFIMYLFALYEVRKSKKYNEGNNSFYLYSLLFATAINLIAIRMNVLERAAQYFEIFCIISLPNIIKDNIINKHNRRMIYIVLIIFLLAYSSTIMYLRPEWNTAYNYKFMSFEEII